MAQLEKEISTRLQANEIQISRLRGQIPSLLMIRGGRVVIDPVKQQSADQLEAAEDTLRKQNARMTSAIAKVAEITKKDLDQSFTLISLVLKVKAYEAEKTSLEQDLIRLQRRIGGKEVMGYQRGFSVLNHKTGKVTESPDPVGDGKKKKQAAEARIKELDKSIEKISKVILKVQPILEEALKI